MPRCSRSEEEVGTNSIAVCLVEKEPIQITGPEHYNLRHHTWTCSSAPVFSAQGDLVGCVTLSGDSTHNHAHTLGMVMAAAEAIHNKLKQQIETAEKEKMGSFVNSLLTSVSDAVLVVNSRGEVTHCNDLACKYLGRPPEQVKDRNVKELFPANPELELLIKRGERFTSREVAIDSRKGRNYLMLHPFLISGAEGSHGVVLALNDRARIMNLVKDFSGYKASISFEDIKGSAPRFQRQVELARISAETDSRILVMGETGTGKELFAQAIHNASKRADGPFVAINCAAIPRELIESEIMGYKEGAFTGARKGGQVGKLELADGGTIFLDEIGEMPLDVQAKLLRVLEDGMITRLGDSKPVQVNVRVIAATNVDLFEEVSQKEFRQDLYFRLSVVELVIPPLRERLEDLPELTQHILKRVHQRVNQGAVSITAEALKVLSRYHWPGNVRELSNVLERAAIVCSDGVIMPSDLPGRILSLKPETASVQAGRTMKDLEMGMLRKALSDSNGNVTKAARKLQISRSTIYRRLKEHGLEKTVNIG